VFSVIENEKLQYLADYIFCYDQNPEHLA